MSELISVDFGYGMNVIPGNLIDKIEDDKGTLSDHWLITMKDGRKFKIAVDWRGQEAYLSLYRLTSQEL